MLLTMLTTLAVALGVRAYQTDAPTWTVPALGAVLGLGFAAKGPIALLVAGLALLLLLAQNRRLPCSFGTAAVAAGAFAALGFGWFALVFARLGSEPLGYFFVRENLERFAGEAFDVGRPVWFYLPAYAAEGLPWSPFLPLALLRPLGKSGGDDVGRRSSRFLAAWVGLVLLPLCLSRGKIDYYLLPLYPAVSLLLGRWLVRIPWRTLDRTWVRVVLILFAAVLAVAVLRPPRVPSGWLPGPEAIALLAGALATSALAALAVAARPTPRRVVAVLAGGVAAGWLVLVVFFLPSFTRAQPNRAIARDVAREHRYRPNLRFVTCSDPARARRDVLFRARVTAEETCELWPRAASHRPYLLLVRPEEDRSFRSVPGYRHVATYRYLPARSLTLAGLLSVSEPGETVLVANFATRDPVAERKRRREARKALHADIEAVGGTVIRPKRSKGSP
jgi:4-amino-4-deoxy-L-arabinose transferase-like glycosyltransferase